MGKYTLRDSGALTDRAFKRGFEEITILPNGLHIHLFEDSDSTQTIRDYQIRITDADGYKGSVFHFYSVQDARDYKINLIIELQEEDDYE